MGRWTTEIKLVKEDGFLQPIKSIEGKTANGAIHRAEKFVEKFMLAGDLVNLITIDQTGKTPRIKNIIRLYC